MSIKEMERLEKLKREEKPNFLCWPHRIKGEGQFIALMERDGDGADRAEMAVCSTQLSRMEVQAWKAGQFSLPEPNGKLGEVYYSLAKGLDLRGLRVLRAGLHLGRIQGKTPVPDHAAAMSIFPPDVPRVTLRAEEARKYLTGESVEADKDGWVLMTWKGMPLGWGKGSGGRIRNHLPKGLRNGRLSMEDGT